MKDWVMELNVPFVKQPPDSVWCGPATATMMLKFYGKNTSLKRVVEELNLRSRQGINNAHLASFFLNHNLKATVQAWPNGMTENLLSQESISGDVAIKVLKNDRKKVKSKARIMFRELTALVKKGGNVIFSPITLDDLSNSIKNGSPVIVCVDMKHFRDISRKTGHYVLVYGIADPELELSQPYAYVHDSILGKERFIPVSKLLDACNAWFGSAIYVTPKAVR